MTTKAKLVEEVEDVIRTSLAISGLDLGREKLIVGVSGGADSLALLHALSRLLASEQLIVAHLDHKLRPTSTDDAQQVAELAANLGVRFHRDEVDVAALASANGWSIEEAGRKARYRFLAQLALREDTAVVVVGHHADDQAETVLMHMLRGSGLAGLRGMQPFGRLPDAPDVWLLRPLLRVSRADILSYCEENALQPTFDETNLDRDFLRNRIRHELLPLLESVNPNFGERLRDMADIVSADYALLQELVDRDWDEVVKLQRSGWVELDRQRWLTRPLSLRRYLLQRAVAHCRGEARDVGFRTLEAARTIAEAGITGSRASLPGGVELRVGYNSLELSLESGTSLSAFPQLAVAPGTILIVPGRVELAHGFAIVAELAMVDDAVKFYTHPDPWQAYVDIGIESDLVVRSRISGERFQPLGLGGQTATVKDVMINRKIPAIAREHWPIVATEEHPVWIVGHVVDHRARVTGDSLRVVQLRCETPGDL